MQNGQESWLFFAFLHEIVGKPLWVMYVLPVLICAGPVLLYIIVKTIEEFHKK